MGSKEGKLLKEFIVKYSDVGSRLFRCNTGTGWIGGATVIKRNDMVFVQKGDVVIRKGRIFRTGWPEGTSDLLGLTSIEITREMVGRKMAVFTAAEVKTGRLNATQKQKDFITMVKSLGGIATVAMKVEDIFNCVNEFKTGRKEEEDG